MEAAVATLLADSEATDVAEYARYGVEGTDADLPAELDRREKRLARLQAVFMAPGRLAHDEQVTRTPGRIPTSYRRHDNAADLDDATHGQAV